MMRRMAETQHCRDRGGSSTLDFMVMIVCVEVGEIIFQVWHLHGACFIIEKMSVRPQRVGGVLF